MRLASAGEHGLRCSADQPAGPAVGPVPSDATAPLFSSLENSTFAPTRLNFYDDNWHCQCPM